jgi:hypothetical protein
MPTEANTAKPLREIKLVDIPDAIRRTPVPKRNRDFFGESVSIKETLYERGVHATVMEFFSHNAIGAACALGGAALVLGVDPEELYEDLNALEGEDGALMLVGDAISIANDAPESDSFNEVADTLEAFIEKNPIVKDTTLKLTALNYEQNSDGTYFVKGLDNDSS